MNLIEGTYRPMRNSKMFLNEVYFWTDTIKDWMSLLENDDFKMTIIDSWRTLINRKKIQIYGFVIMPNHLHVLWEMLEMNGKEMPYASFNKFTSHQFLKQFRGVNATALEKYLTTMDQERRHRFWQRDPLAVLMDSREKVEQKLNYIHLNPMQDQWNLVDRPENYKWSSACYYEKGVDELGILTHYRERF